MKQVIRYQCQFCKKELKTEKGMEKHEARCLRNEEKRACLTCNNFVGCTIHNYQCLVNCDEFFSPDDGYPTPTYLCSMWEKRTSNWNWFSEINKQIETREQNAEVPF
jgi:hypothetical protein